MVFLKYFRISKYSLIAVNDKVLLFGGLKDGQLSADIFRNGIRISLLFQYGPPLIWITPHKRFNQLNWMSIGKLQTGPRVQAAVVSYRSQIYILGGNDEKQIDIPRKEL